MKNIFVVLIVLVSTISVAQTDRQVVILDMTQRNQETNWSRYYGVEQMMNVVGVSFDTTSNLSMAMDYPVIVTGSRIAQDAFTSVERTSIESWVNAGGVWVTSNLRDTLFMPMCGIDSIASKNDVFTIMWDTINYPEYFTMLDDSMEVTISIGRQSSGTTFYTRSYSVISGESLGEYEDGSAALVRNDYGQGHVYTFGPDFRDLIYRTRINQDVNAHRSYSNGFEPSSDVIAMLMRDLIGQHVPNSIYKYTAPGNFSSVLCLTHDVDSRTAMDTMSAFVDAEVSRDIVAQYNITVRYLSDGWMTNFYVGSYQNIAYARDQGHTLASHSVGHFPDFEDETVFPYGISGNNAATYQPVHFSGMTIGGTILGETEVSKGLLESDFNVPIRSWRSGHLAYPDSLGLALEEMGYEFSSTYSSNDILTNFPFYTIGNGSFSGSPSAVLEIPMTISDVFSSDPITASNYMDKVGIWSDVNQRYDRNNAAITLLIHPNRLWKLDAQEAFLDSLLPTQGTMAFEEYGQFWRKRDSLTFYTELVNGGDVLEVHFTEELGSHQSFVVDTTGIQEVVFYDLNDNTIGFNNQYYAQGKQLYYQQDLVNTGILEEAGEVMRVFPNPTSGRLIVEVMKGAKIDVFSISGSRVNVALTFVGGQAYVDFPEQLSDGMYVLSIASDKGCHRQKVILQRN